MVKLSELQIKEVIVVESGKRLGHIADLEIDAERGKIISIILMEREKSSFFGKPNEVIIYWDQIVTIGSDVILVHEQSTPRLFTEDNTGYD